MGLWQNNRNNYIKYMQSCGIQAKIEKDERLIIPKYKGNLSIKYAQPVQWR
jgi:hypothetical protein